MKLTGKLVAVFLLGISILVAIDGFFLVRREENQAINEMTRYAVEFGRKLDHLTPAIAQKTGQDRPLAFAERTSDGLRGLLRIRWVVLGEHGLERVKPEISTDQLGEVSLGKPVTIVTRDADGQGRLYTYISVTKYVGQGTLAALEISQSLKQLDEHIGVTKKRTFMLIGGMVLTSVLLVSVLGIGVVGRPLNHLIEKTRRVGKGDLSGPLHLRGRDELAELAEALNTMCEHLADSQKKIDAETASRIAAIDQLRHADRLRTVGRLASGVAHELGTPLNVVSGRANLISSGKLASEEIVVSARAIKASTEQMAKTIRRLLDFARRSAPQRTVVNLKKVVQQTMEFMSPLVNKTQVTLVAKNDFGVPDEACMAMIDTGQIQQVLSNLLINAQQAMPEGGEIFLSISQGNFMPPEGVKVDGGPFLCIDVRDHGIGIPVENIQHLFEPFFTTKDTGEGTGLGLSISYGIVQEHGGWINVESQVGQGSCFTVYLPRADSGASQPPPLASLQSGSV